jgi:hypothetical protein
VWRMSANVERRDAETGWYRVQGMGRLNELRATEAS